MTAMVIPSIKPNLLCAESGRIGEFGTGKTKHHQEVIKKTGKIAFWPKTHYMAMKRFR